MTAAGAEGIAAVTERAASQAGKWAEELRQAGPGAVARGADRAAAVPLRSSIPRQVCAGAAARLRVPSCLWDVGSPLARASVPQPACACLRACGEEERERRRGRWDLSAGTRLAERRAPGLSRPTSRAPHAPRRRADGGGRPQLSAELTDEDGLHEDFLAAFAARSALARADSDAGFVTPPPKAGAAAAPRKGEAARGPEESEVTPMASPARSGPERGEGGRKGHRMSPIDHAGGFIAAVATTPERFLKKLRILG